ncbi:MULTISPECIES: site-specific integrase [unclassified Marinobacterium]|uniref:site-specific integrase n=1 Tax=unclassified Marinobacterium TaxID=2644139 RepID=UPI001569997B|nr:MULTISPECIES: site-specific integrase [unclassified Marinobacterium]NRP09027.1 hypothetical protein [Marinobacterium sp. xm-g-48]NRP82442.1 hypothetical protein [Marinobacterium sp. xm-d-509]
MPRRTNAFTGEARRTHIKQFHHMDIEFFEEDGKAVAVYTPWSFYDYTRRATVFDGRIDKFPFIFKGNGEPWEMGNLYLICKFDEVAALKKPPVSTFRVLATHITDFISFIERFRQQQIDKTPNLPASKLVDEFYLPRPKAQRITYMYRRDLVERARDPNENLSFSTASNRINAVVDFYRFLQNILPPEKFPYPPYELKTAKIAVDDQVGGRTINKVSTDLAIPSSTAPVELNGELLEEKERLRPLSEAEQVIVNEQLKLMGNYTFQLIAWVILMTSARIQTACTLRIKDLRYAYDNRVIEEVEGLTDDEGSRHFEYVIPIGAGFSTDLKKQNELNKVGFLYIPAPLMDLLIEYVDSEYHQQCMAHENSFYGVSDENYVFLSSRGVPYYTSDKEFSDRRSSEYSTRINYKDAAGWKTTEGESIRQWTNQLCELIQLRHESFRRFRPHDLRATYGLNFVRDAMDAGWSRTEIMNALAKRMSHESPLMSAHYVDFDMVGEYTRNLQKGHSDRNHALIEKYGLAIDNLEGLGDE